MDNENRVVCPKCGTVNEPGTTFCMNCGERIEESSPTPQNNAETQSANIPPQGNDNISHPQQAVNEAPKQAPVNNAFRPANVNSFSQAENKTSNPPTNNAPQQTANNAYQPQSNTFRPSADSSAKPAANNNTYQPSANNTFTPPSNNVFGQNTNSTPQQTAGNAFQNNINNTPQNNAPQNQTPGNAFMNNSSPQAPGNAFQNQTNNGFQQPNQQQRPGASGFGQQNFQKPQGQPFSSQPSKAPTPLPSAVDVKTKKSPVGKIIIAVIAVLVVLGIIGASASQMSFKNKLVGTWTTTIDISNSIKTGLDEGGKTVGFVYSDYTDKSIDAKIKFDFTFEKGGSCYITMDQASYDAFINSIKAYMKDAFINYLRQKYGDSYTKDFDDDELLELVLGEDFDTYFDANNSVTADAINIFSDVDAYEIGSDNEIRIYNSAGNGTDCSMTASISGDTMTGNINAKKSLNGKDLAQEDKDALKNLVFTKN